MFSIGDFARLGLVSVRMLRHYDAIGLLRPAHVDPVTGYRSYQAAQLSRLNRIVAIKDLGFTLEQVKAILDDKVGTEELHGMVRLRRAQLEAQIDADLARLRGVEARLRTIETEGRIGVHEVIVKRLPPARVAELTAEAAGYETEHIGPVIKPLYGQLCERLAEAGLSIIGPGIASYEPVPAGVLVHAAMPVATETGDHHGFHVVDLPAIGKAATIIHQGSMDHVGASFQALAHWVEENGHRALGLGREVYLHCPPDEAEWVTELQIAISD